MLKLHFPSPHFLPLTATPKHFFVAKGFGVGDCAIAFIANLRPHYLQKVVSCEKVVAIRNTIISLEIKCILLNQKGVVGFGVTSLNCFHNRHDKSLSKMIMVAKF